MNMSLAGLVAQNNQIKHNKKICLVLISIQRTISDNVSFFINFFPKLW